MRLNSTPKKTRTKPLSLEEAMQRKAQRMRETHDFFKAQLKEEMKYKA